MLMDETKVRNFEKDKNEDEGIWKRMSFQFESLGKPINLKR
jgi:hypothetical protein